MITRSVTMDQYKIHASSHPLIGGTGGIKKHIEHPVCPYCEKIALRTKGWEVNRTAHCPACGWNGRADKLLNEYLQDNLHRR